MVPSASQLKHTRFQFCMFLNALFMQKFVQSIGKMYLSSPCCVKQGLCLLVRGLSYQRTNINPPRSYSEVHASKTCFYRFVCLDFFLEWQISLVKTFSFFKFSIIDRNLSNKQCMIWGKPINYTIRLSGTVWKLSRKHITISAIQLVLPLLSFQLKKKHGQYIFCH